MEKKEFSSIRKRKVFFDHHGGNNDYVSLLLLLSAKNIQLLGVTVTPAGCLVSDGVEATVRILDFLGKTTIPVARGTKHGPNPYPYDNRSSPKVISALPQLIHLTPNPRQYSEETAEDLIIKTINASEDPVTFILTGPPTNLVAALEAAPEIQEKIEEVVVMGGTLKAHGNVHQYNHDASAEWTFYWDPESSAKLIRSGLKISLFPLEVADACPSDIGFLKQLAKNREYDLSDLACQILAPTLTVPGGNFKHLMADVLPAAYLVCDQLATFKKLEVDVEVRVPSEGKLYEDQGSTYWIQVAQEINVEHFREQYLQLLKRNARKIDLSKHLRTRKRKVYYDHDGNNDDILSLQLVLSMPNIELLGVSVTPADCLLEDGISHTLKMLSFYGKTNIPVAKGKITGPNPFPYPWRCIPKIMDGMPYVLNQKVNRKQVVDEPAEDLLIRLVKESSEPVTILMTGPCTNFAAALEKAPEIKDNIEEVVLMGGAVDVPGNVAQFNHDGSAEWNLFYDPAAAKTVFTSGLEVTIFSLDCTNNVPVNYDFLKKLASQREHSASYLASMLWTPTVVTIPSAEYTYFMWDTLSVAYLGCDQLCTLKKVEIEVLVNPPSEGRTRRKKGSGFFVNMVDNINVDGFFKYYLAQLRNELIFDEE